MPRVKIALVCDRCFSDLEQTHKMNGHVWECKGCATRFFIDFNLPAPLLSPINTDEGEPGIWSFWREPVPPYFRYIGYQGKRVRLDIGEQIRRFQLSQLQDYGGTSLVLESAKARVMNEIMRAIHELKPNITQAEVIELLTKQQYQLIKDLI